MVALNGAPLPRAAAINRAVLTFSGEGEPVAIAADATTMYWVNIADGRLRSAPVTGGMPTTIASGQGRPSAIAVAGNVVYWVNDTDGEVWALHR